jgi:hypothetical protein
MDKYRRAWQMAALSVRDEREDTHSMATWQHRHDVRNLCQPESPEHRLNICKTRVRVQTDGETLLN